MTDKEKFEEECKKQREQLAKYLLTNEEYEKLLDMADFEGKMTIKYIMRIMKETGIRFNSLDQVTVEAVQQGEVIYKNKRRYGIYCINK